MTQPTNNEIIEYLEEWAANIEEARHTFARTVRLEYLSGRVGYAMCLDVLMRAGHSKPGLLLKKP